jgi:hypothetical protein
MGRGPGGGSALSTRFRERRPNPTLWSTACPRTPSPRHARTLAERCRSPPGRSQDRSYSRTGHPATLRGWRCPSAAYDACAPPRPGATGPLPLTAPGRRRRFPRDHPPSNGPPSSHGERRPRRRDERHQPGHAFSAPSSTFLCSRRASRGRTRFKVPKWGIRMRPVRQDGVRAAPPTCAAGAGRDAELRRPAAAGGGSTNGRAMDEAPRAGRMPPGIETPRGTSTSMRSPPRLMQAPGAETDASTGRDR